MVGWVFEDEVPLCLHMASHELGDLLWKAETFQKLLSHSFVAGGAQHLASPGHSWQAPFKPNQVTYIMEKGPNKNMGWVTFSSGQLCGLLSMLGLAHFLPNVVLMAPFSKKSEDCVESLFHILVLPSVRLLCSCRSESSN